MLPVATQPAEKESHRAEDRMVAMLAQLTRPARPGSAHRCPLVLALQGLWYPVYHCVSHLRNEFPDIYYQGQQGVAYWSLLSSFCISQPLKHLACNQSILIDIYISHPKSNILIQQEK